MLFILDDKRPCEKSDVTLSKYDSPPLLSTIIGTPLKHINLYLFRDTSSTPDTSTPNLFECLTDSITCFESDVFKGLISLKSIRFFSDENYEIPFGLFEGLTNLESIYLRGDITKGLIKLPETTFQNLKRLKVIDVSNNPINFDVDVHPRTFAGLNSLKTLKIDSTGGTPSDYQAKKSLIEKYCGCIVTIIT